MAGKALIGYVRVSTSQQGRSGLGLEAQKQALERFATLRASRLAAYSLRLRPAKALMLWSGARSLRQHSAKRGASAARWRRKARPPQPRRSLHQRPDGSPRALRGR